MEDPLVQTFSCNVCGAGYDIRSDFVSLEKASIKLLFAVAKFHHSITTESFGIDVFDDLLKAFEKTERCLKNLSNRNG